ncbi:alpha-ribazole phosphatase [Desulfotomaculum sp. 1211_IL3151]|uniref:alpha-ribazole phosphatase n=1 Tax=Desulfotomaculum sp. 1211_IL3151 TaxID=3084055 RepID=UPI002FD9737A
MEQRYIYLIRHGALETKGGKRFIGQIDLPMSADGLTQVKRLGQELSYVRFRQIFCSDLQRSRQTAEMIAAKHKLAPNVCPELREIHLGEWEGRYFEEIRRRFPSEFIQRGKDIANFCTPGGESFNQCNQRVLAKLAKMVRTTTGNILIVGHAGVNRLILCHVLGMPIENMFRISQDYGCLNLISYSNEKYRVNVMNKLYRMMPV